MEQPKFLCEFCNTSFTTKSSLSLHVRTNKKCIASRPITDESQTIKIISFSCEYCNKEFSQKVHLNTHFKTCKVIKEKVINNDSEELIRVKEELRKLKEEHSRLQVSFENLVHNFTEQEKDMNDLRQKHKDEIITLLKEHNSKLENVSSSKRVVKNKTTNNTIGLIILYMNL